MSFAFLLGLRIDATDAERRLYYEARGRLERMAQGLEPVVDDPVAYDRLERIKSRPVRPGVAA
jgi:hypothetical protein